MDDYRRPKKRSGPPPQDDRDPIDPPRAGQPATSTGAAVGPAPADYVTVKALGLQISVAHHRMIDALVVNRRPPQNKKRYVVEEAIQRLYDQEIGGGGDT